MPHLENVMDFTISEPEFQARTHFERSSADDETIQSKPGSLGYLPNTFKSSSGIGKNVFVLLSDDISLIVWRYRN